MQYSFNTGKLFVVSGDSGPMELALLQDISLDFDASPKELYGPYRFPELVALGKGKVSGKATFANVNVDVINLLSSGLGAITTGQYIYSEEAKTVPVSSTYTVSATHESDFYKNLGVDNVNDTLNKLPMSYTSSTAPSAGEYTVSSGVYTFNAAEAGKSVIVKYMYSSTDGQKITLTNKLQGVATYFSLFLSTVMVSKLTNVEYQNNVWLNACVSSKLAMAWKLEDFNMKNFDFQAFSDATGGLGWMSFGAR